MNSEELKDEALVSLKEYLPRLVTGIEECYNYLRVGNEDKGVRLIEHIVEGINWSLETIVLTGCINSFETNINSFADILNEIINALEIKDYVLLADLLEYEISPIIRVWDKSINK